MHTVSLSLSPNERTINPNIFGQFIEHLGTCIYGGIYDELNPLSNENHLRTDVLEKIRRLSPPTIRFPGGTVVNIYHFEDAIGPVSDRKTKKNLVWGGDLRPEFGPCEFAMFCKSVGAEPMICVNMASGTPEEAGNFVDYMNGTGNTYYANLRRKHGFDEPFNVKYWCVGNECYAEPDIGIQNDVQIYIRDAREFIKFMKLTDPSIELILVGSDDMDGWNKPVLDQLGNFCDYLSYHFYAAHSPHPLYGTFLAEKVFQKKVREFTSLIQTYPSEPQNHNPWYRFPARKHPISLMIDEWNIWDYKDDGAYGLYMNYAWKDAVWVASMINTFINEPLISGANMAQLVNVLSPILSDETGSYEQMIFIPLEFYRKNASGTHVCVELSGAYDIQISDDASIPALSCTCCLNDGRKTLFIVNRDFSSSVSVRIPFDAEATVFSADPEAIANKQNASVSPSLSSLSSDAPFILPAGSICIFKEMKQ